MNRSSEMHRAWERKMHTVQQKCALARKKCEPFARNPAENRHRSAKMLSTIADQHGPTRSKLEPRAVFILRAGRVNVAPCEPARTQHTRKVSSWRRRFNTSMRKLQPFTRNATQNADRSIENRHREHRFATVRLKCNRKCVPSSRKVW